MEHFFRKCLFFEILENCDVLFVYPTFIYLQLHRISFFFFLISKILLYIGHYVITQNLIK